MAQIEPIEMTVDVTQLPSLALSPEQQAVRVKFAMANGDANLVELNLREFAVYRGVSLESVRKNLRGLKCVRRMSQKDATIHLGTWHQEQSRLRAGGL